MSRMQSRDKVEKKVKDVSNSSSLDHHGKCEITGRCTGQARTPDEDESGRKNIFFPHPDMAARTNITPPYSVC